MRLAVAGVALALIAVSTTACGESSSDAGSDEFCAAWSNVLERNDEAGGKFSQEIADAWNDAIAVEPPGNIDDDGRDGYDLLADQEGDGDTADIPVKDRDEKVAAFRSYVKDECGVDLGRMTATG